MLTPFESSCLYLPLVIVTTYILWEKGDISAGKFRYTKKDEFWQIKTED